MDSFNPCLGKVMGLKGSNLGWLLLCKVSASKKAPVIYTQGVDAGSTASLHWC